VGGVLNLRVGDWMQVLRELDTITKKDDLQLHFKVGGSLQLLFHLC